MKNLKIHSIPADVTIYFMKQNNNNKKTTLKSKKEPKKHLNRKQRLKIVLKTKMC